MALTEAGEAALLRGGGDGGDEDDGDAEGRSNQLDGSWMSSDKSGSRQLVRARSPDERSEIRERAARVQAFLTPELFAKMYEQNKGQVLPPAAAIERQMEGFESREAKRACPADVHEIGDLRGFHRRGYGTLREARQPWPSFA